MAFKDVVHSYNKISLIKRILVGLIIGVILALLIPSGSSGVLGGISEFITLLGTLFVSALKAVAPILVFFLVISALCNAKQAGSMKTIVVLYILSTLVAAIVAVCASFAFPVDITLVNSTDSEATSSTEIGNSFISLIDDATANDASEDSESIGESLSALITSIVGDPSDTTPPEGVGEVLTALVLKIVSNPVGALVDGNFLGILAWAIFLGVALRSASQNVKDVFGAISEAVSQVVRWVIACAPFGIMGLVFTSVSENGMEIFIEYGQLILILVACMLLIALVTNPLMVFICTHKNPYPLVLRCLKDSGLTAFFTRSSAANIPVNMELCRKLGLDKDNYSVSIPLGATINMAGAAVTITVMSMAACHTLGISVDPISAVILSVLAAVSACGASGVAGGSLLLIPLACSLFGISPEVSMQVVAIGFIIGVIQDSCETALNSSSDVVFTATAEYRAMIKEGKEVHMGKDNFALDEID